MVQCICDHTLLFFLGGACRIRVLRTLNHDLLLLYKQKHSICSKRKRIGLYPNILKVNIHLPHVRMNKKFQLMITIESIDTLLPAVQQICDLETEEHLKLVGEIFTAYCFRWNLTVHEDFLELTVKAMSQLNINGRTNILYALAKGLGTLRSDGSDTLFPCKQLVTGLLEYSANFFAVSYADEVCMCKWM